MTNSRLKQIATRLHKIEKRRRPDSSIFDKNIVKNKESELLEEARWLGLSPNEINELSESQTSKRKQYSISDIIKKVVDTKPKTDIDNVGIRMLLLMQVQTLLAYYFWSKSLTEYDNSLSETLKLETKTMKSLTNLTGLIMDADRQEYKQIAKELTLISSETAKLAGQFSENVGKSK